MKMSKKMLLLFILWGCFSGGLWAEPLLSHSLSPRSGIVREEIVKIEEAMKKLEKDEPSLEELATMDDAERVLEYLNHLIVIISQFDKTGIWTSLGEKSFTPWLLHFLPLPLLHDPSSTFKIWLDNLTAAKKEKFRLDFQNSLEGTLSSLKEIANETFKQSSDQLTHTGTQDDRIPYQQVGVYFLNRAFQGDEGERKLAFVKEVYNKFKRHVPELIEFVNSIPLPPSKAEEKVEAAI